MVPYMHWQEATKKAESAQNQGSHQKVRIQPVYHIHQLKKSGLGPKIHEPLSQSSSPRRIGRPESYSGLMETPYLILSKKAQATSIPKKMPP